MPVIRWSLSIRPESREQLTAAQAEFIAAQSELTNAQAAITQAQSRIASAQSQYTHGSATAPFSGKFIASSTFAAGPKVSAGQTIGRMVKRPFNCSLLYSLVRNMPKISRPVRRLRSLPLPDRFPLWFRRLIPLPAKVLSLSY